MLIQNTIQQICMASGLQGADLEALKTRLAKMSQAELQAELTKALSGEGLKETEGVYFERTTPVNQSNKKQISNNKADLTLEQAQTLSIEYIFENIRNATNVYMNMDPGLVGYGYDQLKNFFETEFSSKNVYEVILKEEDCANFLLKAQEGSLTKREYYEQNKLRLKEMLFNRFKQIDETGVDAIDKYRGSIPRKEFEQIIENYVVAKINSIQTMEGIKELQYKLIIASDEDENELIKNLAESAKAQIYDEFSPKDTTSIVNLDLMPKGGKPHPYDSDEKMTFEETYLLERGVEFNETKIENLMQAKGEMSLIQGAYNKLQGLKSTTKEILKQYQKDSEPLYDESGNILQEREPKVEPRLENIENIINEYYAASPDNGTLVIDDINRRLQLNLNFGLNSEGKIEIGFNDFHQTDASKNKSLNLLLRELSRMQEKQFNELCGDKTIEEYISDYENSYAYSMGEQNVEELSRAMEEDNINFVDKTTGTVSTVGMGILMVGGIVSIITTAGATAPLLEVAVDGAIALGGAVAMGGMVTRNLFGFADTWKMKSGFSDKDLVRRSKDLVMDLGGLTIGAAAGKLGLQKALEVARNGGSQTMAMIAEHGTDFTLSLAGDLAMIGALNYDQGLAQTIKQNGIGILVSTVTGIKASKQTFAQGKVEYAFDVVMPRQEADGMNIVQRMSDASESTPAVATKPENESPKVEEVEMDLCVSEDIATKPRMDLEADNTEVRAGEDVTTRLENANSIGFIDKLKLALNFKGRKLKEDFLKTSLHSLSNNDKLLAEHFIDKALIAGLNIESFKHDIEEYIKLANNTNNPKDTINTIADFYIKFKSDNTNELRKWHAICDQYLFSTESKAISNEVGLSFMKAINESNITSSQIKMIITQGKPNNKIQPWESLHLHDNFSNSNWKTLIEILPAIKDLPADKLGEIDFVNLIKIAQVPKYFNALSINNRLSVAENIDKIPIEIQEKLKECKLDVQDLKTKLLNNSKVTGFEVNANPELQKAFFRNVINNNSEVEKVIRGEDFNKFLQTHKNQGLPLKYSRTQFNQDLKNLLNQLPENDKIKVLQQLNISLTDSSFEGFVKLNPLELNNFSSKSQNIIKQINNCLENFGKNNEIQCDNPEIKRLLDSIIQGFPEFLSIIGKQDAIHPNKLDIHILETLYNALNHPNYSKLNYSDKTTLKLAILMHDIGKVEGVNGPHSDQSTIYANNILSKFNLGQNTKENIIELIRFHHFTTEKYDYPINVGVEHIANILADCDYKARFDKSTTIQSSVTYPKNNYQHAKYKTDHALNTPEETYISYERKLSNGRVIKAQIADMRNTSVHESARNYGWSAAGEKKLKELIVLSHNCQGIEKVRNLLEAYENPLHDFEISAHSSPFIDLWNGYESRGKGLNFSILLSAPDHHIGKAESSGQVSGRKKGRENFVMNTEEQDPKELAKKRDNETTVLRPKVERIVILNDITPDKIPDDLIQLSEKYNVPIIIYGKKYRNW